VKHKQAEVKKSYVKAKADEGSLVQRYKLLKKFNFYYLLCNHFAESKTFVEKTA